MREAPLVSRTLRSTWPGASTKAACCEPRRRGESWRGEVDSTVYTERSIAPRSTPRTVGRTGRKASAHFRRTRSRGRACRAASMPPRLAFDRHPTTTRREYTRIPATTVLVLSTSTPRASSPIRARPAARFAEEASGPAGSRKEQRLTPQTHYATNTSASTATCSPIDHSCSPKSEEYTRNYLYGGDGVAEAGVVLGEVLEDFADGVWARLF